MTSIASIEMTEAEAMVELIGRPVAFERETPFGTETIVGSICTPLMIEETETGAECITAVSISGEIVETHIAGLPGAIAEGGKSVMCEFVGMHRISFI